MSIQEASTQDILASIDKIFSDPENPYKQSITSYRWFVEQQENIIKHIKENNIQKKTEVIEILKEFNKNYNKKK